MNKFIRKIIAISFFIGVSLQSFSQITLSSISELLNVIDDDNINAVMTPATYSIGPDDVTSGLFSEATLFTFSGSNSTYDFTGVTFEFDTDIFRSFGSVAVTELHVLGSNIVLSNLTITDIGNTQPSRTALCIQLDGADNRIEGFDMTIRGSYPYGYGDIFGKGSGYAVKHYKHAAVLVRGDRNHVKNCNILHRAYGHGVFMQGAVDALIEGVYLEGEVRSTDDILAETGTVASERDFLTVWGYTLPAGYMISKQEDGIRAYNSGSSIIDGVTYEDRRTTNITVLNSTVKNMRDGISLALGAGTKYVEGCTTLGCETGYTLTSGTEVVNSSGDAIHGPLYRNIYGKGGIDMEVELLSGNDSYYNGSKCIAYLAGSNNNITITSSESNVVQDHLIQYGGALDDIRFKEGNLDYQHNHSSSNVTLNNYSGFTVFLPASISTENTVNTCGEVINNGSGNTINYFDNCEIISTCKKTTALTEAECYDDSSGVQVVNESVVGYIENGDWTSYSSLNLTDMNSLEITYSSGTLGGSVEVRLDAVDGLLIGKLDLANTGGWDTWETSTVNIERVDGLHDIFLVFTGGDNYLFNIDKFGFSQDVFCDGTTQRIEAECYDEMSGIQTETCSEGTENVGYINNADWLLFQNIDLTDMQSIKTRVACNFTGGMIEVRTGSESGTLIGEIPVTNTGGNQAWETDSIDILPTTGLNDVYLVFTGGDGYLFNVNWLEFSAESNIVTSVTNLEETSLSIYPNPVVSTLFIKGEGITHYELFNVNGELKQSDSDSKIEMSSLATGIYFIKVYSDTEVLTKVIMKK